MATDPAQTFSDTGGHRRTKAVLCLAVLLAGTVSAVAWTAQEGAEKKATGWVCGTVLEEGGSLVAEAQLRLFPETTADAAEAELVAKTSSDAHGAFCLKDLPPGFYQLQVQKSPWPPQTLRRVEIRAGLLNRLLPIELEWEPGEPRISYAESLEGLPAGQARGTVERLLLAGDSESIRELVRRLLPKGGVRIDLGRLMAGLDVKPLMDELLRQLDRGYLPPIKTARYVYAVGELADPRTEQVAAQLLIDKLRDARPLPLSLAGSFGDPGKAVYVSDVAIHGLARLAGKDFRWKYGKPPPQNQSAISNARLWWRREYLEKERSGKLGVR